MTDRASLWAAAARAWREGKIKAPPRSRTVRPKGDYEQELPAFDRESLWDRGATKLTRAFLGDKRINLVLAYCRTCEVQTVHERRGFVWNCLEEEPPQTP